MQHLEKRREHGVEGGDIFDFNVLSKPLTSQVAYLKARIFYISYNHIFTAHFNDFLRIQR